MAEYGKAGFKSGFVNIFGPPNAGKSTLLNALLGEQLAITSPKVQTTRHRILGILNDADYQVIFSDTPGIIEPKYKLHQKMMQQVKNALEDADVVLLIADITQDPEDFKPIAGGLKLRVPTLLLLNKADLGKGKRRASEKGGCLSRSFPAMGNSKPFRAEKQRRQGFDSEGISASAGSRRPTIRTTTSATGLRGFSSRKSSASRFTRFFRMKFPITRPC